MEMRENEKFTQLLRDAVLEAEGLGYRPNQFKRMLEQHGGFETVQRVLATGKPSDGFTRLWELGRLDLSCEALIVETKWRKYFDPALLVRAEALLAGMKYSFKAYTPVPVELTAASTVPLDRVASDAEDTPLSSSAIRINSYFRNVLLAPVANDRWSWGSVDEIRRCVFLRVWKEDITQQSSSAAIRVLAHVHSNRHGWAERRRHLDLVKSGYDAYAIVCQKGTTPTTRIASFDAVDLLKLSDVVDIEGDLYMTLGNRVPASSMSSQPSAYTVEDDLENIWESEPIATSRRALMNARLGQGRFRRDLLQLWGGKCAVTGSGVEALLRASHCKPWRDSNDSERLDPSNGLPLTANLDALFDAMLISFDDDGAMLTSPAISPEEQRALGIPAPLVKRPSAELGEYLKHHRERFHALRSTCRAPSKS